MRGVPRWIAVVAVLAVVAVVCAFTVHHALAPAAFDLQLSASSIPADGFSTSELTIHSTGHDLRGIRVEIETPHQVTLESLTISGDAVNTSLQAGVIPGEASIRVSAPGFTPQEIRLTTTPDNSDSVGDGTPDFLRLHDPADRRAFRHWFTLLAESQFYRPQPMPEVDDCAALLRFSYREAMRQHDSTWAHAVALPAPASVGDIRQYQYPYTPLAADIFRVKRAASPRPICATVRSPNLPTPRRSGGTTLIPWDAISRMPVPATCCSSARTAATCPFTP